MNHKQNLLPQNFECKNSSQKTCAESANIIVSQSQLNDLLTKIKLIKLIAIDTEFVREKTYFPILSLVQIAVKNLQKTEIFLIDCLANLDLTELISIIYDKKITKILHSSTQDLQIFQIIKNDALKKNPYLKISSLPQSCYDIQIMANLLYHEANISYAKLTEKFCNYKIEKDQQRSNWEQRPLSESQILYAVQDVKFMFSIYYNLLEEMVKSKRMEWFYEEMDYFISSCCKNDISHLFRKISPKEGGYQQKNHIWQLVLWREEVARQLNIPRQHFIEDGVIVKIANFHSNLLEELHNFDLENSISNNDDNLEKDFEKAINQGILDNFVVPLAKKIINISGFEKIKHFLSNNLLANQNDNIDYKNSAINYSVSGSVIHNMEYNLELSWQKEDNILAKNFIDYLLDKISKILNIFAEYGDVLQIRNIEAARLNNDQKKTLQNAQKIVVKIAKDHNICPNFLINNNSLKEIIANPSNLATNLNNWRHKILSEPILKIINDEQ